MPNARMIELKPMPWNRRAWHREMIAVPVRLEHPEHGTFHAGVTINVGQGGALVTLDGESSFAVDDTVRLAFASPDEPVIRTDAMTSAIVRRVEVRSSNKANQPSHGPGVLRVPRVHQAPQALHETFVALQYVPAQSSDIPVAIR